MRRTLIIAGLGLATALAGAKLAWPQTKQMFSDQPVSVACFQNGTRVFELGPLKFFAQVGDESSAEYTRVDGSPGQIRVIGSATCVVAPMGS